jgi:hypothetical protein
MYKIILTSFTPLIKTNKHSKILINGFQHNIEIKNQHSRQQHLVLHKKMRGPMMALDHSPE